MKIAAIMQYVLVLVACSAHVNVINVCGLSHGNESDWLSLLEFKKAISLDPQQALMSWNDSTHFCHWEGVLCSIKTPNRVTSLNLTSRGLVGQISPSLGNLTFLKFLVLPTNSFNGEIPQSLSHLQHLQKIFFNNNTLQGRIPNLANCSSLKVLNVYSNNLAGQLHADLPHQLETLVLSRNNLTGAIPSSLANITMLNAFACIDNNIAGNIPDEFAELPRLQLLELSLNRLVGSFPKPLLNVSTLVLLNLALNHLRGELPPNIGNYLPNLQGISLAGNSFHGHIPHSMTNASNLHIIDMSINNFTGPVPSSIGKLGRLSWLNLEMNGLHGSSSQDWEFMNSLANCTELQILSITGNRLEGRVPNSFGNHSNQLQNVYMGTNQLSGGFPSGMANLPNLVVLELAGNQFTGVLPSWLGALKSLQALSLHDNVFTGSLPPSIYNLSNLVLLYLDSNRFNGEIEPSLGNLRMLTQLNLSSNNLRGTVPGEIFRIPSIMRIELSGNNLGGELPINIGNARQLVYLQLSSNKISGDIPYTLGDCESLEGLKLDGNDLNGTIPDSLGNMRSLKVLNLSHNNLTGTIPSSLGELKLLQKVDLSFNHLNGEVPTKGIFMNATGIQIEGNQELCGGVLELHLLACSTKPVNSSKHKQSNILWKVVIPLATTVLAVAFVISIFFLWRSKHNKESIYLPSFDRKFPKVSYNDLARATQGFSTSNLIGRGRYGSVYQGNLFQDRNVVAIKVFDLTTKGAHKSFVVECNALRNTRHRNLVPIFTACSSVDAKGDDFKALVYEFMPKGDLHALLYSARDGDNTSVSNHITLAQRLGIVVYVADALEYLHHNNQGTIIHCDIKPSNILLDDNMTAHVGDFGLAIFRAHPLELTHGESNSTSFFEASNSSSSVEIKGTIGYVAPECALGGQASTAADVYSFGVVALEMFIRRRPTDDMFKDGLSIAMFVEMNFPDNLSHIVDPQLVEELHLCHESLVDANELGVLRSVISIGLCCTKASASERLSMQEVAAKLHEIRDVYNRG